MAVAGRGGRLDRDAVGDGPVVVLGRAVVLGLVVGPGLVAVARAPTGAVVPVGAAGPEHDQDQPHGEDHRGAGDQMWTGDHGERPQRRGSGGAGPHAPADATSGDARFPRGHETDDSLVPNGRSAHPDPVRWTGGDPWMLGCPNSPFAALTDDTERGRPRMTDTTATADAEADARVMAALDELAPTSSVTSTPSTRTRSCSSGASCASAPTPPPPGSRPSIAAVPRWW